MRELDETTIKNLLAKDYIGRNSQLEMIIEFIYSFDENLSPVLAIDSPWGSGKTVFTKQLCILNEEDSVSVNNISADTLEFYRKKYETYYFNAWENDYIEDPLQALILNLIENIDPHGLNANGLKKAYKAVNASGFLKKATLDGIDLSRMTKNDIIQDASLVAKRKQYIHDLVNKYLEYKEKRLLFIIDELDRCKPSFAVNLLEAIKHYFTNNNIVFIIATNNSQLAHTVCKYYGNDFDGAAYLDRFFDYAISLQKPDVERYVMNYLGDRRGVPTPIDIATYLDMSMREIEHYFKSLELLEGYMNHSRYYRNESLKVLVKYILIPFVLALKIVKPSDAKLLLEGKGDALLKELVLGCDDVRHKIEYEFKRTNSTNTDQFDDSTAVKTITSLYRQLHGTTDETYEAKELRDEFRNVSTLISSYSTIKNIVKNK